MTITLTINGTPVPVTDEAEINQQINRRRDDGAPICVHVQIMSDGINLPLGTPGCGGRAGGRQPSALEQRLIELWRRHGLSDDTFSGGNVVAFLRDLRRFK